MFFLRLADNTVPAGNSFNTSAAENNFASAWPLPANSESLSNAGRTYVMKAYGYISSLGSSPGSLTLKVKWGATVLGTATISTLPTSLSSAGFMLDALVTVCTTGTSGKVSCQGFVTLDNVNVGVTAGIVNTGTVATGQITVNTQTAANLQISETFSVSSASNIITLSQLLIGETT